MADEQYQWLDGDAAERLLRGEPLEAVDDHARVQAERLSAMLGEARRAAPKPLPGDARAAHAASGELPGEAAALAAFRAARAAHATRVDDAAGAGVFGARSGPGDTAAVLGDSGAVRIGSGAGKTRARWGRPVRYGLAAALAACTLGGVAMAGAGVIPTPFGGDSEPGPGASVSAAPTDPDLLISPTPGASESGPGGTGSGSATPDGETEGAAPGSGHPSQGSGDPSASGGIVPTPTDSVLPRDQREQWYARVVTGCRDYLAGKPMDAEKKRRIEASAGGPERVRTFCAKVLSGKSGGSGGEGDEDGGSDDGKGGDRGDGSDDDNRHEGNGGTGAILPTSAAPTSAAPAATATATATPTATSGTPTTTATPTSTTDVGGTGNP